MKTTVTQESPTKVRLFVEASAEEVAPAVDRAFRRLAGEVKVPGFRKGKVPRPVLEARVGADEIREAAIREAVPQLYAQAVVESDVEPITTPEIEVKSFDEGAGLAFEALVEVRPEIRLPDLWQISVERPSARATDEEVEHQLQRLRDRFSTLETVPRPGRRGDYALIDLRGYVHDRQVEEATATDLLYEVGSGSFVPELDQELEGRRQGEILKFNATLPPGFPGEFAGKEIAFQVLVKEVRQKVLPELDDDFARSASEFDALDQLRADLRTKIGEIKTVAAEAELRNRVLEQVVRNAGVVPPDALVNEEMAYRLSRLSDQLRQAGISLDDYLGRTGQTDEQVEADLRAQSERNVCAQLVLDEIGRREGLQATDAEVDEELRRHAQDARRDPAEVRKRLESSGRLRVLAADIIRRKALDLVVERADIKEADPPGAAAPGKPGADDPA